MKPFDFLAEEATIIQSKLRYVTNDLEAAIRDVDRLKLEQAELMDSLDEFDKFFDSREAIEDAVTKRDKGVLVEPTPEDVRQPSAEPGLPL